MSDVYQSLAWISHRCAPPMSGGSKWTEAAGMSGTSAEKSDEPKICIASPAAGQPVRSVHGDGIDAGFPLVFHAGPVF
jgi:hypothetical protein